MGKGRDANITVDLAINIPPNCIEVRYKIKDAKL